MAGELGTAESGSPWYRHFWPWFIVLLLGTTVVAGIVTVFIAFANQDSLVRSDYYEDGMTINRRLDRERHAASLGLNGTLSVDPNTGIMRILLSGPATETPEKLRLTFSHATQSARDFELELERVKPGVYEAPLEAAPVAGRWYASIEPLHNADDDDAAPQSWRLSKTLRLPAEAPIVFGASP
jgi:hypothetical protein